MATAEQSDDTFRDYSSPATWGDVERVRLSVETQIATRTADLEAQIAGLETKVTAKTADLETQIVTRTADLETQLATTKADLETQIATRTADLEKQIAGVETQAARSEARLIRWMVAAVAGGVAIMSVLLGILEAVR